MTDISDDLDNVPDGLVQMAKTDRNAFGQLFDQFYSLIFAYCSRRLIVRAVAEDVTSNVFLKVAGSIRRFSGATSEDFRRWLFRIATNEINAHLRQSLRRRQLLEAAVEMGQIRAEISTPLLQNDFPVEWEDVYRVLAELSDREQSVISLRFFGGLKHNQIAGVLELRPGAVRTTLSRALDKLRERLLAAAARPSLPSNDGATQ